MRGDADDRDDLVRAEKIVTRLVDGAEAEGLDLVSSRARPRVRHTTLDARIRRGRVRLRRLGAGADRKEKRDKGADGERLRGRRNGGAHHGLPSWRGLADLPQSSSAPAAGIVCKPLHNRTARRFDDPSLFQREGAPE